MGKTSLEKLLAAVESQNARGQQGPRKEQDPRFWKPTADDTGNASAIIRFLPNKNDDDESLPWVRYWDHGFRGPSGKWYIERSLKSIGKPDPVYEENARLYNMTKDPTAPERIQASKQKRRLHYVSNILVISDPNNPEAEGKVFMFIYGKKIFDKILLAMKPEFVGETRINPFDVEETGANFKLRQKIVSDYPNYDHSSFDTPKPLAGDVKNILKECYNLEEVVYAPENYKTYDELKARLEEVLDNTPVAHPIRKPTLVKEYSKPVGTSTEKTEDPPFDLDDDDLELERFKALAED